MTEFNNNFWDKLRKIVREEVDSSVESKTAGIRNDISGLKIDVTGLKSDVAYLKTDVGYLKTDGTNLRAELADIKSDLANIKQVQGSQGLLLRTMNTSLTNLKNSFRSQAKEIDRFGILLEDLEYRFEAGSEIA